MIPNKPKKYLKPVAVKKLIDTSLPQIIDIAATAVDLADPPNGNTIVPFEVEWSDDLGRTWKCGMEAINAEDAINVVMSFWNGTEPVSYEFN